MSLMLATSGCKKDSAEVNGNIEGADKDLVIVEKSDFNGRWVVIDSTRTSSSGNFKISIPRQTAPEIMRLVFNNQYIYFPLDSVEQISIKSTKSNFDTNFEIEGSEKGRLMSQFEKELIALPVNADQATLSKFKRAVYTKYIQTNPSSILAYYVLTKTRNNTPIFNPDNREDVRYYAAVATAYKQFSPDDPRTALLEQTALSNMRRQKSNEGRTTVVNAPHASLIDITLPDENNREVSLAQVAANGHPTILVFSLMCQPDSPAFNSQLRNLKKGKGANYNIYHVSLDADMYAWREAAMNLPWTTVLDPTATGSKYIVSYNVQRLPTFFIINSNGELTNRAESFDQLIKYL